MNARLLTLVVLSLGFAPAATAQPSLFTYAQGAEPQAGEEIPTPAVDALFGGDDEPGADAGEGEQPASEDAGRDAETSADAVDGEESPNDDPQPTKVRRQLSPPYGDPAPSLQGNNDPEYVDPPTGPLAQYNASTNRWLPLASDTPSGWLEQLAIPRNLLDCCQEMPDGCRVFRSYAPPRDPSIDQNCVTFVKEPCLGYKTMSETVEVVVYRCQEKSERFTDCDCQGGQCVTTEGQRRIQQLVPCKVKVPLKYKKPCIIYRDVYYYLDCCK